MSIFKDDTDYSHIKPQPYDSFEEEERKREEARELAATQVNEPLTAEQQKIVREQADINPVTQMIEDVLDDMQREPNEQ